MRFLYVLLFCSLFSACDRKESDLQNLLNKVYEAHGVNAWDSIEGLAYEKESIVYNADKSKRLHTTQKHSYQMKPDFSAEVNWVSGEDEHQILYVNSAARKLVNGVEVDGVSVRNSSAESVNAALYTVSQPFKLRDPGVILTYEGIDMLENEMEVHVVKASYNAENQNHTKNDEWWYYFDVDNYLCRATMVHHGSTYSYIRNLTYDQSTGVILNAHREGYAVDSTRKILYRQSEYFYRDYKTFR